MEKKNESVETNGVAPRRTATRWHLGIKTDRHRQDGPGSWEQLERNGIDEDRDHRRHQPCRCQPRNKEFKTREQLG